MSDELLIKQDGAVLRITINRPADGNRVSSAMAKEIASALDGHSSDVHLIVLDAAGKDFCNGWTGPGKGVAFAGAMEAYDSLDHFDIVFDCYASFRRARAPVVGVVRGAARGFGCALVSACDIAIASDGALFQIPEMSHNILPTMVMWSLHDRVPYKALSYLAYTTAEIGAQHALTIGRVSAIAPVAKIDDHVRDACSFMLARPLPALRGLKEYLRSAPKMDAQGALDFGRNLHATINTSSALKINH